MIAYTWGEEMIMRKNFPEEVVVGLKFESYVPPRKWENMALQDK